MKDNFENFIKDNRDEFDLYEPSDKIWEGIRSNIEGGKVKTFTLRKVIINVAAAVLIFFGSYAVFEYVHYKKGDNNYQLLSKKIRKEIPELYEAEVYYTSKVNNKLNEVSKVLEKHPDIAKELKMEMQELDSLNKNLVGDLKDNIANQEIIESMIQNYRIKLSILEELSDDLEDMHSSNKKKSRSYEL